MIFNYGPDTVAELEMSNDSVLRLLPLMEERDSKTIPFKTICQQSQHIVMKAQRSDHQLCLEKSKRITRMDAICELSHQKLSALSGRH